jgi:hypothetical protein
LGLDPSLTPARRRALTTLIAILLAVAILGSFWPRLLWGYQEQVGLHQPWDVFAPDPVHAETTFEAVVTFADGTSTIWQPPHADALRAGRSHRWELWQARLVSDEFSAWWDEAAHWIGRQHHDGPSPPLQVALYRRWSPLPSPGADNRVRAWNGFEFYVLKL